MGAIRQPASAFEEIYLPPLCVSNEQIKADAAIAASKLCHQYEPVFSMEETDNVPTETKSYVLHRVKGATAQLIQFAAGQITMPTASTKAALYRNDETSPISTVTITATHTSGVAVINTATASFSAGDIIKLTVGPATTTTEGLGEGIFAQATIQETT